MNHMQNNGMTIPSTLNTSLDEKTNQLVQNIIEEENPQNVKDLISLFNLNHTKKQVLRMLTNDQLLDHILNQMEQRVTLRSDQFSNRDLLDYMNAMSGALEKAQKQISDINAVPAIQINQQNNINISDTNVDNLTKESRKNIMGAIQEILSQIDLDDIVVPQSNPVLDNNMSSELTDSALIDACSEDVKLNDYNKEEI